MQIIVGGNITLLLELCEKTRGDAYELMIKHETEMDGNAIVGCGYDAVGSDAGRTKVLCYGTAGWSRRSFKQSQFDRVATAGKVRFG